MADGQKFRWGSLTALAAVVVALIGLLLEMTLARPELKLEGIPTFKVQPPLSPPFGTFWMDVGNTGKLSVAITKLRGKLDLAPTHINASTKACRDDLSEQKIYSLPEGATLSSGHPHRFGVGFPIPQSCVGLNEPFRAEVRFSGHDQMYIPFWQTIGGIASLTEK